MPHSEGEEGEIAGFTLGGSVQLEALLESSCAQCMFVLIYRKLNCQIIMRADCKRSPLSICVDFMYFIGKKG